MKKYTEEEPIIRGSRWPPGEDDVTLTVTHPSGWPADADTWTWELRVAQNNADEVDVTLEASSASIDGNDITLLFHATPTNTADILGSGRTIVRIELVSYSGDGTVTDDTLSYWYDMTGQGLVYDPWD